MADNEIWAVVPVKQLALSKTRLGEVLDADERRDFSIAMVLDVLTVLKMSPLDGVLVVSADAVIVELVTSLGIEVLILKEDKGICDGLEKAAAKLKQSGVGTMAIVPGDVPDICTQDIECLINSHGGARAVTLVEAVRDGGTNALVCSPPDAIPFLFGRQSGVQHKRVALEAGVTPMVLTIAGFARDIDTPDDLMWLSRQNKTTRAREFLLEHKITHRIVPAGRVSVDDALALVDTDKLDDLMRAAATMRDEGHGSIISYSRKVFIPLTKLCRDVCHYCTFAKRPSMAGRAFMSLEEVLDVARAGVKAGCKEALFTLGDKPELRYQAARDALAKMGYETTLSYLKEAAALVFKETGLMPHINAGVMSRAQIEALREVSISQGIMLESISDRLGEKGGCALWFARQKAIRSACFDC